MTVKDILPAVAATNKLKHIHPIHYELDIELKDCYQAITTKVKNFISEYHNQQMNHESRGNLHLAKQGHPVNTHLADMSIAFLSLNKKDV